VQVLLRDPNTDLILSGVSVVAFVVVLVVVITGITQVGDTSLAVEEV
jgi:hypothetical protein